MAQMAQNHKKAYVIVEGSVPSYEISLLGIKAAQPPVDPQDYSAKVFSKVFSNLNRAMFECASLKLQSSRTDFYVQEVFIDDRPSTDAPEVSAFVKDLVHVRMAETKQVRYSKSSPSSVKIDLNKS